MYYLYVKTHNKTGLKYLGKTKSKNPHKYQGSGTRWVNHIKKHGYDVTTEIIKDCSSKEEVKKWGSHYSKLWDVVKSKEWANLREENGDGGDTSNTLNYKEGMKNKNFSYTKSEEFRKKISKSVKSMWKEKFSDNDFDLSEFKNMCSKRSKKMWESRGITDEERTKRSYLQKKYMQDHRSKKHLSKKIKEIWIEKSRIYDVTFPDGHSEQIKCLRGWCKNNNLPYYKIYNTLRNKKPSKDGWFVKII